MTGPVGVTPLADKLFLKPGMSCLTIGAPTDFQEMFESIPPGVNFETRWSGEYDWAILFASHIDQVAEKIPILLGLLEYDGLLWVAYPKTGSAIKGDLTRDDLWDVMRSHGYKAVTQVYLDADWTAMRFRRLELIGR